MEIQYPVKVVKIGNSVRITLPSQIVKTMKIKEGEMMYVTASDDTITVRKAK